MGVFKPHLNLEGLEDNFFLFFCVGMTLVKNIYVRQASTMILHAGLASRQYIITTFRKTSQITNPLIIFLAPP